MRKHKFTPYDAGQELIKCADQLAESEGDLRKAGYTDEADMLQRYRLGIGYMFNMRYCGNTHKFGLPTFEVKPAPPESEAEEKR